MEDFFFLEIERICHTIKRFNSTFQNCKMVKLKYIFFSTLQFKDVHSNALGSLVLIVLQMLTCG